MADYFADAFKQYTSKLPSYQAGIDPLKSYYTNIMQGGPAMLQAMAPEVDATSQQFQQAMRNTQNNAYARGGGLERNLANLEAGRASTISQLLGRARPWAAGQLGSLLSNQQSLGLNALIAAQAGQQRQQQLSFEKWKGIGGGIMDLLRTPIGKGGSSALGTLLGKIPGLGTKAATGASLVGSLSGATFPQLSEVAGGVVPSLPTSAIFSGESLGVPTGAGGFAATGLGHTLGLGGGSGLFGLGSATIPVIGGLVGAGLLGKSLWEKSQVHRQADQWVQGDQNKFDQAMAGIDTAGLSGTQADALRKQYMTDYLSRLQEFSKQGGHQKIVADQALNTFRQWYTGHANRLGVQIPGGPTDRYQPMGNVNSFDYGAA